MTWPLSKELLNAILADQITDFFLVKLVWERLGYQLILGGKSKEIWVAGLETPSAWKEKYPNSPEVIAERKAAVYLTRSIPKEYKQSLKEYLNFKGYRINELFPRRTRRASAVNWLIAYARSMSEPIPEKGPLPFLLAPPSDPSKGHPGDKPIE